MLERVKHFSMIAAMAMLVTACNQSSMTIMTFYLVEVPINVSAECVRRHGAEEWPIEVNEDERWLEVSNKPNLNYCQLRDGGIFGWELAPNRIATHRLEFSSYPHTATFTRNFH